MTITKETIGESYEDIKKFNEIASNLEGDMVAKVDHQLSLIFEELTEAIEGVETGNAQELLDGAIDTWVTAVGLLQKLEAAGFDVAKAMRKVDENNLSKFPYSCGFQHDPEFNITLNDKHQRWVIKDENGKVRKPADFEPVDLSDCVPKDFFNNNKQKE